MIKPFGNASEVDIVFLEEKYDLKLPDDYKFFLQICNGGICLGELGIPIEEAKSAVGVRALYGINTGTTSDINDLMKERADDIFPHSVIIGDAHEFTLLLVTCGDKAGIWLWDHAYYFETSSDDGNCYFVAKTFTEFAEKYIGWKP